MFEPLTVLQRTWLLVLLAAWAILLFGGFAAGQPDATGTRRMPLLTRLGSSLVLVIAAWSWCIFCGNSTAAGFSAWVAVGMTLGFTGDLFMARVVPVRQPVLWGLAAFGLGHVAYITAVLSFGGQHGPGAALPRGLAWAAWAAVGTAGCYLAFCRSVEQGPMRWAALLYALLLASTAGAGTGLAWQHPEFVGLAVGAALFLVSDSIVAARLFGGIQFPLIDDVVWLTYGPAQALIVYSSSAAIALAR